MRMLVVMLAVLARAVVVEAADCDLDGVDDGAEIAAGAADCNGNGIPDVCERFPLAFDETRVPVGAAPGAIVAAELTGDSHPDLAVANPDAGTLTIFEGAAGGVFTSPDTVAVGARPEAIAAFQPSGLVVLLGSSTALAVANGDGDSVSLLANNGDGTFTNFATTPFLLDGHPDGIAVGDLRGSGPDIVVTTRDPVGVATSGGISVVANDGVGGFMPPGGFLATGAQPRAVVVADMDDDGFPDALVANRGAGTVTFLRNNGGVFFSLAATIPVGDPAALAVADVDTDGDLDLAVLSGAGAAVRIFLNDGAATFTAGASVFTGAGGSALRLVDLDGNGAPDVVAVSTGADAVVIALNDGAGAFGAPVAVPTGDGPVDVAPVDADGDGRMDLVVTNSLSQDLSVLRETGPVVRDCDASGVLDACEPARLDCNGNGVPDTCDAAFPLAFGAAVVTPAAVDGVPLAVGDVDGDGRADVVLSRTGPKLAVLRAGADGTLAELTSFDVPDGPARVLLVDVDGDGDLDYVVTSTTGMAVYVLRNGGTGAITATDTYALAGAPSAVVAGDFTGDGVLDLAVGTTTNPLVLPGTGGGAFGAAFPVATAGFARDLVAGDVDGDGDLDLVALVFGGGTSAIEVIRNDPGLLSPQPPVLQQMLPSLLLGMTGGDLDGDGDLDLVLLHVDLGTGVARLRVAPDTGGTYAFAETLPFGQAVGSFPPFSILLSATASVADLDGDGHVDVAMPAFFVNGASVFRNHGDGTLEPQRTVPVGVRVAAVATGDVSGDGVADLVAAGTVRDHASAVLRGLGLPPIDVDGNGVPDCHQELRCGDCADDDGDGLIDVADPDCAATALTLRQIAIRPARGRRPARAKLVADVAGAVTPDPATTALGVTLASDVVYCGTPALRRKGKRTLRLATADRALTGLVVQTVARHRGIRAHAALSPVGPSPSAGDVARAWLTTGGHAFRGEATLRKKGKTLVAP